MNMRFTPGAVIALSITAAAFALIANALAMPVVDIVLPSLWVLMAVLAGVRVRGESLFDTWHRRRNYKPDFEPVAVVSRDKAGIIWDGEDASVVLELTPNEAFSITAVDVDDNVSRPAVDVEALATMMTQSDIILDSISVISMSYRTAVANNEAASAVSQVIGITPAPYAGRTLLVVKLNTKASHAALKARALNGSVEYGIERTVLNSAVRITYMLDRLGVRASLLSEQDLEQLNGDVVTQIGLATDNPSWQRLGADDRLKFVAFEPTGTVKDQRRWLQIESRRTYEMTQMYRARTGEIRRRSVVAFVVRDEGVLSRTGEYNLNRLNGQHKQVASQIIPMVKSIAPDIPDDSMGMVAVAGGTTSTTGKEVVERMAHYPSGMGVYIGDSTDYGRIFVSVASGTGVALHLIGPIELAELFLLRMLPDQLTIDVRINDNTAVVWKAFVERVGSPLLKFNEWRRPDVVVVKEGQQHVYTQSNQTVLVVAENTPNIPPRSSIVARGGRTVVVTINQRQVRAKWVPNTVEIPYLVRFDDLVLQHGGV